MRSVLTILLVLCVQAALAGRIAHLTISSQEHYRFTVYLDGEAKNLQPLDSVRILNLPKSYYRLRIEFEDTAFKPIEKKTFQLTDVNGNPVDAQYVIRKNKKGEMSINFLSQTIWPVYIDPGKPAPAEFPGSIAASIKKKQDSKSQTAAKSAPLPATPTVSCPAPTLTEIDFAAALASIAVRSSEDSKLLSARQIISTNCLTTDEVKKIMTAFTSEDMKLEIAKYAYIHTVDKGSYFKLNSQFKNDSSVDELNKSILR